MHGHFALEVWLLHRSRKYLKDLPGNMLEDTVKQSKDYMTKVIELTNS